MQTIVINKGLIYLQYYTKRVADDWFKAILNNRNNKIRKFLKSQGKIGYCDKTR